jgi:uncharacterized coiled-coil protein SlyX
MTALERLEARIADLEATVKTQQTQIENLQTDLDTEREARKTAEQRVDSLQSTCEKQSALLDALRKRTTTTQSQLAELQTRELEKGAHLEYEHVTPTRDQLDLPENRLERFSDDEGTEWVRLPDHEDPLERSGTTPLPTADLLPIQQLARMDNQLLSTATSRRADYLAAKAWAERGTHDRSTLWSRGCNTVSEYVDASDVRVWIKSTHERADETLSYDHAKKLAGQTLERIRKLANDRVYIEKRTHRKDGLEYKERRLVVPSDLDISGTATTDTDTPGTTDLPG